MRQHADICFVADPAGLELVRAEIEDLCLDLAEENIFYEPWMLLPAIRHMGQGLAFEFALMREPQTGRLCGFFPFVRRRLAPGLPLEMLRLWNHPHCTRCTPLIRKGMGLACWRALLDWLADRKSGRPLLDMIWVPLEGEVGKSLERALQQKTRLKHLREVEECPVLDREGSSELALRKAMSGPTLSTRRRQLRKLEKQGHVSFADIEEVSDIGALAEEFIALEAKGWKGKAGTALASHENHGAFFLETVREAQKRGRLSLLHMRLDGCMIAARVAILAADGSFSYKLAFDEDFDKAGPGVLLEIEEVRRMHDPADPIRRNLTWADAITSGGGNPSYRAWAGRKKICRIWVAPDLSSSTLLSVLPLILWIKRLRSRHACVAGPFGLVLEVEPLQLLAYI